MENLDDLLRSGAETLGRPLTDEAVSQFRVYAKLLLDANRHMNLTAVTEPADIYRRHFLDSLALGRVTNFDGKRVIDVGTGAGFPGLPIKLVWADCDMTMLDSLQKRVSFLEQVCGVLGSSGVTALHGRAEELGREDAHREVYDIALSRAVARLDLLAELCLPFVKPGGLFLAMKTGNAEEETLEATLAIEALGGRFDRTESYQVPGTEAVRGIIIIEKIRATPDTYPRRFAKMQKSPIA